jgi:hypothetical protein
MRRYHRAAMDIPPQIGRFRVTGRVGEGAMGVVLRGRDEALDRDVALKVMRAQSAEDKERFLREARAIARLQHPNIITVYELGEHEGSPFIAMELLEGVDLQRAIEGGMRPNPRATLPIVLQLLAGLGHAHEHGIVHRDVKPSNLFLPRGRPAKIMDFGVARLGGTTSTSSSGLIVGTPNYMSPEQVTAGAVDGRSDLFSAGLILYELVTGEKAFQGDSVVALMYKIAHEDPDLTLIPRGAKWDRLRAVLTRAFFKDAVRRYPNAGAMSADLALALQDLGGSLDEAAASDKGMVRRASYTAPGPVRPARTSGSMASEERPSTPPPAAPAPAPSSASGAASAVTRRPAWLVPAVIGVAVLAATAVTMIALLVWPRDESGRPTPAASARPRDGGDSLVSGGARLASPTLPPSTEAPPDRRPAPTTPRATPPPRVVASVPLPTATADGDRVTGAPPAAGARLDRANDLYEKGRYAAALAEAKAVLRGEPGNREAKSLVEDIEADIAVASRLKQAQDAMRRGDREEALAQVRAGLAVKGNDGRLLSLFKELTQ